MLTSALPFAPITVVIIALLNPAVIAVSLWMGTKANEPQKLVVAAFAGAAAGIALIWLLAELRFEFIAKPARAAAGIFALQFLFGLVWAAIGYKLQRRS